MKGKRVKQTKYSFWHDAFWFSVVIWFMVIIYCLFAYKATQLNKEAAYELEQKEVTTTTVSDGRIPGDGTPAEGYASLEALKRDNPDWVEQVTVNHATFIVTHYCGCSKCCGKYSDGSESQAVGASGVTLQPYMSVAVDPAVIPLGTVLYDHEGNAYSADDTGGAIKGNRIDMFVGSHEEALKLGVTTMDVYW